MTYGEISRGLTELQLATLDASDEPDTYVEVADARAFSFNTEADSDELEGYNRIIAKVQNPTSVSGSFELGRINLAALAVLTNAEVATTGTTPDEVTSLEQSDNPGVSYYSIIGQAPGVDVAGSAYRVTIKKALTISGPDETMEVNSWNTPTITFEGVAVDGVLIVREQYETMAAIPPGD